MSRWDFFVGGRIGFHFGWVRARGVGKFNLKKIFLLLSVRAQEILGSDANTVIFVFFFRSNSGSPSPTDFHHHHGYGVGSHPASRKDIEVTGQAAATGRRLRLRLELERAIWASSSSLSFTEEPLRETAGCAPTTSSFTSTASLCRDDPTRKRWKD